MNDSIYLEFWRIEKDFRENVVVVILKSKYQIKLWADCQNHCEKDERLRFIYSLKKSRKQ